MFRLRRLSEAVRELAPQVATDAFASLTHLGDPVVLLAVVAGYYWLSDERSSAGLLVAYTLVAVALTLALKEGLAAPRPPADVRAVAPDPGSHGFPSGHAVGATVVYGGLVLVEERLRDARAVAAGLALIGLVGLSRVVIGVHYLGDVLAGHVVGGIVLGGLAATGRDRQAAVCALSGLCVLPAVVVTGGGSEALLILGGAVGGAVAFGRLDPERLPQPRGLRGAGTLAGFGFAFLGGVYGLTAVLDRPVVTILAGAVMVGGAVALPAVVGSLPFASPPADERTS